MKHLPPRSRQREAPREDAAAGEPPERAQPPPRRPGRAGEEPNLGAERNCASLKEY
jgi:hypothetical protein